MGKEVMEGWQLSALTFTVSDIKLIENQKLIQKNEGEIQAES